MLVSMGSMVLHSKKIGFVLPSPQPLRRGRGCWLPALLSAVPCRHLCVFVGIGARWELGACVQLLPSVLIHPDVHRGCNGGVIRKRFH